MKKHPLITSLVVDLPFYIKFISEPSQQRIHKTLEKIAKILYEAIQLEMGLQGRHIPARMQVICHRCHEYDPECLPTDKGITCSKCIQKEKKVKKFTYEVVLQLKTEKSRGKVVGVVNGDTISEVAGEFGTFAMTKGYTVYRPEGTEHIYENTKGDRVYMQPKKKGWLKK